MSNSKAINYSIILFSLFVLNSTAHNASADVVTDWNGYTADTASGTLNGIEITGARIAGATFSNLASGQFSTENGKWSAGMPLSLDAEGIIVQPVLNGSVHQFSFSSPMSSVLFYISNFDSLSDAIVTADGAVSIEMITGTSTMFFDSVSGSSGRLFTDSSNTNGFADAVLQLSGNVQSVHMQYSNGFGNNGIGYTFVSTVPEPSSFAFCTIGFAFALIRRRKKC